MKRILSLTRTTENNIRAGTDEKLTDGPEKDSGRAEENPNFNSLTGQPAQVTFTPPQDWGRKYVPAADGDVSRLIIFLKKGEKVNKEK